MSASRTTLPLLALLVVVYLAVVQWAKRAFYRHRDAFHAAQADSQ